MIVLNLHGGPGSGKSTLAAGVFAILKSHGVAAELVPEFAKQFAWEHRDKPLACQPYVFGNQLWALERLRDTGIEVAISDSPIGLSAVYAPPGTPPAFLVAINHFVARERPYAINVFVRRANPYDPRGRFQTEDAARELDGRIMETCGPFHMKVDGSSGSAVVLAEAVRARLRIGCE